MTIDNSRRCNLCRIEFGSENSLVGLAWFSVCGFKTVPYGDSSSVHVCRNCLQQLSRIHRNMLAEQPTPDQSQVNEMLLGRIREMTSELEMAHEAIADITDRLDKQKLDVDTERMNWKHDNKFLLNRTIELDERIKNLEETAKAPYSVEVVYDGGVQAGKTAITTLFKLAKRVDDMEKALNSLGSLDAVSESFRSDFDTINDRLKAVEANQTLQIKEDNRMWNKVHALEDADAAARERLETHDRDLHGLSTSFAERLKKLEIRLSPITARWDDASKSNLVEDLKTLNDKFMAMSGHPPTMEDKP